MDDHSEGIPSSRASQAALDFGSLIRNRRKALKMRQHQLAMVSGVGRRFLIELEAGKATCQLGRSLLVADALGITLGGAASLPIGQADLPDLPDELPE
jgi:y4mF family transcriptional regulator